MLSDSHSEVGNSGRYSDERSKGAGSSFYSHNQYNHMMQHMDPHHYNQFRRLVDNDTVGESPSTNPLSDSANMEGEFFASHMTIAASGSPSVGFDDDVAPPAHVDPSIPAPQVPIGPELPAVVTEPTVHISSPGDVRHSTRPKKHPTWMNDFVTNATDSTPYPLSNHLTRIRPFWGLKLSRTAVPSLMGFNPIVLFVFQSFEAAAAAVFSGLRVQKLKFQLL
ncbi:hypothetical protein H5410_006943 [Solanum commersonii]|uniref:Uncharacterized protein n=1 Tax=Solanum commersonii TaxID=4109 RepID=A0A9J6AAQ7_SOLCO|nr:hypothetical protein H5410_006943 [Solanum commersonii]